MALQIAEKDWGGITVCTLSGRVVLGEESSMLRNKIKALLAQGKKRLVLDLGGVSHIDSAGLGTLIAAFSAAASQDANVKLANLSETFAQQLNTTKLYTIFDVHSSAEEAVMAFKMADDARA